MPTYAYRCGAGHQFEVVQSIVDPPLLVCSSCALPVRRVVFPVGIVFKGQGFYKTDSRSSSSSSMIPAATSSDSSETAAAKPAAVSEPSGSEAATTPADGTKAAKPDSAPKSAPKAGGGSPGAGDAK